MVDRFFTRKVDKSDFRVSFLTLMLREKEIRGRASLRAPSGIFSSKSLLAIIIFISPLEVLISDVEAVVLPINVGVVAIAI